jgi:uncharacterized 2Fe-2S/4Fe-4S cluster protein (DUF4445 family)
MPDHPGQQTFLVDLQPVGRRIRINKGATLLEAAQAAGVELVAVCGGNASCGTCRVRLAEGSLSRLSLVEEAELSQDEVNAGIRMACQAEPLSDVRIDIPPESLTTPQRLQIEGQGMEVCLDPLVKAVDVRIPPPDLNDLRSDVSRLKASLARKGKPGVSIPPAVLAVLPEQLRAQGWSARLALRRASGGRSRTLAGILPAGSSLLGLAVDIGTTKLAAYLVDLDSGETLAKTGAMNPQIGFGEDVISRISYANEHAAGRETLQSRLIETLNQLINELCSEVGKSAQQIVEAVVVGNTAMHHLFAGLAVQQLGHAPYVPVISDSLEIPANALGLEIAPGALVYLPPNIAGYVGADHIAMLLAMDMRHATKPTIALDIGTNTEITLSLPVENITGNANRMLACSCASGPAFEGAHIQAGMRAAPGAIERVQISDGELRIHTIGGLPPVGICGSGILDSVAQMLVAGLLDHRGVLRQDNPLVRNENGRSEFLLAAAETTGNGRDLVVSREDIKEIQLAKGAIRAGVEILLAEAGLASTDIRQFIVAGAFGTYLDLESAVRVGMFPVLPRDRFQQVGNAAGMGARQLLLSATQRRQADEIANQVEYIELTTHAAFTNEFIKALVFEVQDRVA